MREAKCKRLSRTTAKFEKKSEIAQMKPKIEILKFERKNCI